MFPSTFKRLNTWSLVEVLLGRFGGCMPPGGSGFESVQPHPIPTSFSICFLVPADNVSPQFPAPMPDTFDHITMDSSLRPCSGQAVLLQQ